MKFRTLTRILLMANGTRIVFDCATEVCVINADATGFGRPDRGFGPRCRVLTRRWTNCLCDYRLPASGRIAVRNQNGTIVRMPPKPPGINPVWSPDGASVLFEGTDPLRLRRMSFRRVQRGHLLHTALWSLQVNAVGSTFAIAREGQQSGLAARTSRPAARILHAPVPDPQANSTTSGSSDPDGPIGRLPMAAGR